MFSCLVNQSFATILGFAEQLFSIVCLFDCSIRRPIVFGLTEPSVSIVHSLILDLWLFDRSRPIVWPIAQSFAVSPNRCPWSVTQLLLAYFLACRSIVLGLYL